MINKRGFTLIELLVVVLIIGVLTAILAPQYRLAVARTRVLEIVTFANRLHEEQKTYRLNYGTYADALSKLDINWDSCSGSNCVYGKITAGIGSGDFTSGYWMGVRLKDIDNSSFPTIETYETKRYECLTYGSDSNKDICKMFGGRTRPNNTNYYYMDKL